MRKSAFAYAKKKGVDQLRGNGVEDQPLFFQYEYSTFNQYNPSTSILNSKFQASIHVQWVYSPVCVGPGRKP